MANNQSPLLLYSHHLLRSGSCSGCSADAAAEQLRAESNRRHSARTRRKRVKTEGRFPHSTPQDAEWVAVLQGVPQQPDGKPVNYRNTRHQAAIEFGAFDDGILALLRKEKGGWRVVAYDIGSTDYPAPHWQQKYKAPPGIFPHQMSQKEVKEHD